MYISHYLYIQKIINMTTWYMIDIEIFKLYATSLMKLKVSSHFTVTS